MEQKNTRDEKEAQREKMIKFIINAIRQIDDRKLRNVYHFILHIQ